MVKEMRRAAGTGVFLFRLFVWITMILSVMVAAVVGGYLIVGFVFVSAILMVRRACKGVIELWK